jgi:hypothetical protein
MNSKNDELRTTSTVDLHVQEVVRSAECELLSLLMQRQELMKRIASIKQTLMCLADMFGESLLSDELLTMLNRNAARQPGFTQACRRSADGVTDTVKCVSIL